MSRERITKTNEGQWYWKRRGFESSLVFEAAHRHNIGGFASERKQSYSFVKYIQSRSLENCVQNRWIIKLRHWCMRESSSFKRGNRCYTNDKTDHIDGRGSCIHTRENLARAVPFFYEQTSPLNYDVQCMWRWHYVGIIYWGPLHQCMITTSRDWIKEYGKANSLSKDIGDFSPGLSISAEEMWYS